MPRPKLKLFLHWIPALIGITVIVIESTGTMSASNTSRWLLPIWTKLFGPVTSERWEVIHHWIRKTGHFVGYGLVSLGFFEGWRFTLAGKMRSSRALFSAAAPLALFSTVALASWDEWHQSLIPGRTSTPVDVGIDFSGAFTAHLILLLILLAVWRTGSKRS
jgi:VanZ family protein